MEMHLIDAVVFPQHTETEMLGLLGLEAKPLAEIRQLRSLCLHGGDVRLMVQVIDTIITPNLEKIALHLASSDDEEAAVNKAAVNNLLGSLTTLTQRSSCLGTLTTARIEFPREWKREVQKVFPLDLWSSVSDVGISGVSAAGVVKWIGCLPAGTVQSLSVARSNISESTLRAQDINAEHERVFPVSLSNLRAVEADFTPFEYNLPDRITSPSPKSLQSNLFRRRSTRSKIGR